MTDHGLNGHITKQHWSSKDHSLLYEISTFCIATLELLLAPVSHTKVDLWNHLETG